MEVDMVNTNAAGGLSSWWLWDHDSDVGCTTALGVLDSGSGLGAGVGRLAVGAILHGVVQLQVAVILDGDLESVDGELVGV